ncbi:phage tail tape measure protein [Paenibacillus sp. strain BS8-2]
MTVQIGELRARLTAESAQMKQEVQAVKKGIADLGEEGKRTSKSFDGMNAAVAKIAANTNHLKAIEQQLKKIDPAKMEQGFGAVVVELQKMGAEKKQIEALEQALTEMSQQAQAADTRVGQLEEELKQLGSRRPDIDKVNEGLKDTDGAADRAGKGIQGLAAGIAGLGAGAALAKLVSTVQTLASEANQLASSYRGLSVVVDKFNVDTEQAVDLADKLADRWGLNKGMLADTVKTYTTMNLSLEDTERIITATADTAAYNRQSHLTWGEAIKQVAEGVKSGNSNLTDAAGITTNLSVMQDRYAKSIGTTAAKLTEAQKVQAAFNGMIEEGAIFAGNADDAMTGYTGTQASFQSTMQEARVELGEAFIPALERILELLTPIIKGFATWADGNKNTVTGLTAAAAAVTALIAVVGALAVAFVALNAVMGPIGWTILAIGSLIAGVGAYTIASNQASEAVRTFTANQEQLNKALRESPINLSANEYKMLQGNMEQLNEIMERRNKLEEEYNKRMSDAQNGLGSIENTHALLDVADAIKAIDKELKALDFDNVEEARFALRGMQQASEQALGAKVALTRETMREKIALADTVSELKTLSDEYDKLNSIAKLTEQQKARLAEVIKQLKQEYPDLIAELDEENRWHIKNKDALDGYISGEENRVNAAIKSAKTVIQVAKTEAEERVRLARESISELERLEGKGDSAKAAPFISGALGNFLGSQSEAAVEGAKKRLVDQISQGNYDINEASKLLDDLTVGIDAFRTPDPPGTPVEEKKSGSKPKTKAELEREAFQESLKLLEYKHNMDLLIEQQEVESLERLRKKYEHNADIRMELEVRIHQLKKQMADDEDKRREEETKKTEQAARDRFEHSSNWILQEERRMVLAGESEEAIAKMKMEAWTRVRNRYAKDSDYYKQADTQLYNLRVELIRRTEKEQQEAAREQETLAKDAVKRTIDAIDKAKRAELDSLDDRRMAIQAFYDDQAEAIDDSERLKERNELVAEMDKYQHATSERGQKTYLELKEKLRQMDVDQQKRNLEDQRDQELDALDKQKKDIESFYDDLRLSTEDLAGDLTKLYKLADDERLKSFKTTNEQIKLEMATLVQALASYQSSISMPSSGGGGGGSSGVDASKIAQMQANSAAWHTADAAGKKRLSEDNKAIGESMGAAYNSSEGKWYKNGAPLYHTGGIAGEMNFRSPYDLAPDEITAILRRGEPVLTKDQISSLVSSQFGGSNIHIEKFMEVYDPVFEDGIDLRSFGRDAGGEAAEILRKQLAGGG